MKKLRTTFAIIFLLSLGIQFITYAQVNKNSSSSELIQALENRTENEKKISTNLYSGIFQYQKNLSKGMSVQKAIDYFNPQNYFVDSSNRLLIIVRFSRSESDEIENVRNAINNSGGIIERVGPGHNNLFEIDCWMPVEKIMNLISNPDIAFIESAVRPITRITTAGDTQLKASNVRQSMNVTGVGNKIGVMSDGVKNWWDAAQASELSSVTVVQAGETEGNEGTAMLEIIYDLAPGAQLYFSGLENYTGNVNLRAQRIAELENYGCNIIVDDIYSIYEPFFTDETELGTAIRDFIANGNVYISAAGNERKQCLSGTTVFSNLYNVFPSNYDYYPVTLSQGDEIILQWATSWSVPAEDFDLELYDTNNQLVISSDQTQSPTIPPYEYIFVDGVVIPSGSYRIKIKRKIGSDGVDFKVLIPGNNFVNEQLTNQIFGHPAYPNVISVAAYEANNQNTTSSFSSIGPGVMYSSTTNSWTEQKVPTITATSGVETWVGTSNNNYWPDGDPVFSGTSAAAPHIAGLAALYFEKFDNKSNFDFIEDLKNSASSIGSETGGVWHEKSGWGKADILAAINRNLAVAMPVIEPSGGYYSPASLPITITCSTPESVIYYTENGTEPTQTNGTQYQGQFQINTEGINTVITIKAKAFKDGQGSSIAEEVYTFNNASNVATVYPGSGTYPIHTEFTISWPDGYDCWYQREEGLNPPDPPSPESQGGGGLLENSPKNWELTLPYTYKVKFQLYKDGNWGPVVFVQWVIEPELRIAQIDDEITGDDKYFGYWNLWEDNQWNPYPDTYFLRPEDSTNYFIRAQQNYKVNTNRKYNVWRKNSGESYWINHAQIPVDNSTSSVLAHFKNTYNATVTNGLEGIPLSNVGHFYFYDPWFIDDNSDPKGIRNRGADALPVQMNFQTDPNITTDSEHQGVFLDQGYDAITHIWTPPYYKVKAPAQTININGTNHQMYFLDWESTNATLQNAYSAETGVAFHADNAEVTANYKGSRLSTDQSAVRGWSQRKMARTSDGNLHLVYESMGKVWYEYSTDNGNTWNLINLQNGESKLPSIDTFGNQVGIVYQEKSGSDTYFRIHIFNSGDDTDQYSGASPFETGYNDYKPVIGMSGNGRVFVAFINSSNVVKWCLYYIDPGDMGPGDQGIISQSLNVKNISVASDKSQDDLYHIVWQSGTQSIKYIKNYFGASSDYSSISTGSGFEDHRRPEVTVVNGNPVVAWVGERTEGGATDTTVTKISAFGGGIIGGGDPEIEKRAIVREYTGSGWSSTFDKYGQDVVDVAISTTGSNYALAFHREYDGLVYQDGSFVQGTVRITKGIKDSDPTNIETFSENGGIYYISNGATFYNIQGVDIDQLASSSPYSLRTNSLFSPSKIAANDSVYIGREGVCQRDSIQFYFTFGEIFVDGMPVFFNEPPKELKKINNTNKMNKYLVSEPFVLEDNSSFTYGMMCGLADSSDAGIALRKNEQISFKIELVDEQNKDVLGIYDNVTFTSEDTMYFANRDYTVETNGIGNKTVRLRLQITDNFKQDYTLGNLIADKDGLYKKGFETINYKGELLVKDYGLVQNYPNPFNPTTIIKYQIPKEGIVKLKVYDILGREVTTLVDRYQVDGRYEVEFDARNLASGVYIYRLEANDFVDSKKMLLVK